MSLSLKPNTCVDSANQATRRHALCALGICLAVSITNCRADADGARVELLRAIVPSTSCTYEATNPTSSQGFYDPTVNGALGYELALVLRNNLATTDQDTMPYGDVPNINARSHDVAIAGFEGCWYLQTAQTAATGELSRGSKLVDCKTLPDQSGSIVSANTIEEGGNESVSMVTILTSEHLRQLFGATFDTLSIPPVGLFESQDPSVNPAALPALAGGQNVVLSYSFALQDPNSANRSQAWGEKYPTTPKTTIIVQLRGAVTRQNGDSFYTNYIAFPVTLCMGCLQDMCGPLVQAACPRGPCPDGSPCLIDHTCPTSASGAVQTCASEVEWSGARPNWSAQGTCLPAQNFLQSTAPTCTPVGCGVATP